MIVLPKLREVLEGSLHGPQVIGARALARLLEARWLAAVGEPSDHDRSVERVSSWVDAVRIFATEEYAPHGIPKAPRLYLLDVLDAEPSQATAAAADAAARSAVGTVSFRGPVDDVLGTAALSLDDEIAVGDYITSYIRFLYLEIYAERLGARSTYFRDQLAWWVAGFFPCGWVGKWPEGRLRVF